MDAASLPASSSQSQLINDPVPSSSASDSGSVTLVNEEPAVPGDLETPDEAKSTSDATTKTKDVIQVLVDKPGYRKELRTTSKGRTYEIETSGLWTTLRSLTPNGKKKSFKERLNKRLKSLKAIYPFLVRFAKEVLRLGRWRFLLHLVGSTVTGLVPALRMYLYARLINIAQTASEKRILRKGELFLVASTSYLSSFLETFIDGLLADNNGVLQRRFESMVQEHLMSARSRLDVHTLNKSRVTRDFASAAGLVHALGDGRFVINQVIDLFTSAMSLVTQASMLWSMTSKENADLALVSIFSSSLMLVRWFFRRFGTVLYAITDPNYNRMTMMEAMSHPDTSTFGERKVLGLGEWALGEYRKASRALGDVSVAAPTTTDAFNTATGAIQSFSDTAIYVLFALKVADRPLESATLSISSLTFIQSAARGLASSLYRFVWDVKNFGSEFSAFQSYYRLMEIKTLIKEPVEPVRYETVVRKTTEGEKAEEREGMEIEFKDVVFRWPGKKENALDGISFKIQAGELCAIVGYNGAGKSTLIALIARLCDPSSGEILINGRDIKSYSISDLHKAMSLLFQSSAELPLSLREFIGVGNMDEIENLDRIRQAASDSGAIEFIDKLEKGFESSFSADVEPETAETLYKDAVEWDNYDSDDDDEESDNDDENESESEDEESDEEKAGEDEKDGKASEKKDKKKKKMGKKGDKTSSSEDETSSDSDDEKKKDADGEKDKNSKEDKEEKVDVQNGRLAFSGGQRQKLVMARNFMRTTADLAIFDEYSANLDPVAEHELFKRITANRGKQTLLYITHRYSTVRHADRILMLEKGKVTESGTHDELMAIPNGKYSEMSRLALGETDKRDNVDETNAINTPLPASRPGTPLPVPELANEVPLPASRPESPITEKKNR